jgi:tetratricopeptide (TPR) repeat protein
MLRAWVGLVASLVTMQALAQHGDHGDPAAWTSSLASLAEGADLLPDLGTLHRDAHCGVPRAQAFFDQGLRLAYGFNHDEAARSFAQAAALSPKCAMCWWGVALTLGPNYNTPLLPDRAAIIWEALNRAKANRATARPVEQALIDALAKRYPGATPAEDRSPYDAAYAEEMRKAARKFPDDLDVQTLFAEALMDVRPWRLWTADGKPAQDTEELVATLERVMKKSPQHPGANHYYIHAIEASPQPERGVVAAERLASLMPAAGHVVHMPAHIFQRVGRYADAAAANRRAIVVDEAYLKRMHAPGYYGMYLGHNHGFLSYAAAMLGRRAEAIASAQAASHAIPPGMLDMMPGMDFIVAETTLARVRFGQWQELLTEPAPPEKYSVLSALHLHGVAMAHASLGHHAEARKALDALEKILAAFPKTLMAGPSTNTAHDVVAVAAMVARARIEEKHGAPNEALAHYRAAVTLEDGLAYNEPADWFYPVRQLLGAALLDAGKAKEAEAVFAEDLRRNPNNGWSLYGRWQALLKLARPEAAAAEAAFRSAWSVADVQITRAAF